MTVKKDRPFIKSADTSTAAVNSRAQVDKMLRRYGASAISIAEDIARREVVITFIVPNSPDKDAGKVPVKLPISISAVYHAMYDMPTRWVQDAGEGKAGYVHNPSGYDRRKLEQAERVAWRNLVLWIDAALSAASIGLQTITEAFFAHAVVGENGKRMVEVVEEHQESLGRGVQRLLTAGANTTVEG